MEGFTLTVVKTQNYILYMYASGEVILIYQRMPTLRRSVTPPRPHRHKEFLALGSLAKVSRHPGQRHSGTLALQGWHSGPAAVWHPGPMAKHVVLWTRCTVARWPIAL